MFQNKNAHLISSVAVVSFVAFAYGVLPNKTLPIFFDFSVETTDLHHVFRATMGLYLGNIALWSLGIFNSKYWKTATIANVVFMSGLVFGRLLSVILDGFPSPMFTFGLVGEIIFAFWGLSNLKKYTFRPL